MDFQTQNINVTNIVGRQIDQAGLFLTGEIQSLYPFVSLGTDFVFIHVKHSQHPSILMGGSQKKSSQKTSQRTKENVA